jgi:cysteine desulfuration protein SufE
VWLTVRQDEQQRIALQADSDSAIVKGLCAVILALYSGKTPQEIGQVQVDDLFERMGLHQHLSPNRRSGFFSMVQRVQALAA